MFNFRKKKNAEIDESYKYTSNALSDIITQKIKKVFSITSGCSEGFYRLVAENIFKKMIIENARLLFIDARVDDDKPESVSPVTQSGNKDKMSLINASKKTFEKIICDNEANYDIILAVIPPVILKADALEYAKVCKNAILIEKYMHSRYEDYENSLLQLKNAGVNVEGVIACK